MKGFCKSGHTIHTLNTDTLEPAKYNITISHQPNMLNFPTKQNTVCWPNFITCMAYYIINTRLTQQM